MEAPSSATSTATSPLTDADGEEFLLGVNYWPRSAAMQMWKRFPSVVEEIERDFALMRTLGISLVRIFLLWEDFQPEPVIISEKQLQNLVQVCDLAQAAGLKLDVTFFVGHMSGPNWAPKWLLQRDQPMSPGVFQVISGNEVVDCGYRNFFTDPHIQSLQVAFVRAVVHRLKDHPAVAMWNLGNEPDLFARAVTPQQGAAWVRRMTRMVHCMDMERRRPVTCGLHVPSLLQRDVNLHVHRVFRACDLPVIHGYSLFHPELARSPLDPLFVPFLCALTRALCEAPGDSGREGALDSAPEMDDPAEADEVLEAATRDWSVLAEEFGACTQPEPTADSAVWAFPTFAGVERRQFMAGQQAYAAHLRTVLPLLQRIGARGAVLWCWADYARELHDAPPCNLQRHERHFGLVDADGQPKPHAQVLREFAAQRPRRCPPAARVELPCSADAFYALDDAARLQLMRELYQRFCATLETERPSP